MLKKRQLLEQRHGSRLAAGEDAAPLRAAALDGCAELPEFAEAVQRLERRLPELSDKEVNDFQEVGRDIKRVYK